MRDGPASAAKHFDVARPALAQKIDDLRKKLHMSAIVTGNADGADIFLDRSADNIADRAVIAEINHLNPLPDEFQIDRIDRAVVPIANRHGGKNADR